MKLGPQQQSGAAEICDAQRERNPRRRLGREHAVSSLRRRARLHVEWALHSCGVLPRVELNRCASGSRRLALTLTETLRAIVDDPHSRSLHANALLANNRLGEASIEFQGLVRNAGTRKWRAVGNQGLAVCQSLSGNADAAIEAARTSIRSPFREVAIGGCVTQFIQSACHARSRDLMYAVNAASDAIGNGSARELARFATTRIHPKSNREMFALRSLLEACGAGGEHVLYEIQLTATQS